MLCGTEKTGGTVGSDRDEDVEGLCGDKDDGWNQEWYMLDILRIKSEKRWFGHELSIKRDYIHRWRLRMKMPVRRPKRRPKSYGCFDVSRCERRGQG